ncbi:hypothetical protein CORC01_03616 [Colletotrichum orchidophilum]|uniref:Uncharacterized protein n=1 Tax=Colletotrichum orchidophilum TaxID=1209926 RepID=A0A1G4BI06_9PEZI|nr:uncharacterized protein CORC01_03616 [Colletotrichum orchidophilum]OHF01049.1 hypothetical protein CORC01_03616 [Colletotrichum orchidophilum]
MFNPKAMAPRQTPVKSSDEAVEGHPEQDDPRGPDNLLKDSKRRLREILARQLGHGIADLREFSAPNRLSTVGQR